MNRKTFLQASLGCCAGAALDALSPAGANPVPAAAAPDEREQAFVQNWLTDLLDTMEAGLDEATRVKLIEGCGRGCYRRHAFKQDLAAQGQGDVDRLIEALRQNFEVWREGDEVHLRYGEVSPGCYCPAAYYRPAKPNDLHCECSRTSHQTIWETALGRPFQVDIVESVRRGGQTCHFVVHLA
jgi:hypothetical protein